MLLLALTALARPPGPEDTAALAFQSEMERMWEVISGLKDCTFTFESQEYVGNSLTQKSTATVKFRVDEDIYMKFTAGPNEGRELVYRGPDWNGGKFRIDPGPWVPVLNLHPEGKLARRGNRHTLRDLPLPKLGKKIIDDALKVRDHATWAPEIEALAEETIGGRAASCYESKLPKDEDPSFYAHRVHICIDGKTGMPARLKIWDHEDGEIRLIESYAYLDLEVNTGLTDADFDPETYGL